MNNNKSGIILLVDSSAGIYIPRVFKKLYLSGGWRVPGITSRDLSILDNPEHDEYWDVWGYVLNNAEYINSSGDKFIIYQDGDLWALCPELMNEHDFFRRGCVIMDQYGLQRIRERIVKLPKQSLTMLEAVEITRELHIISEESGMSYSLLTEGSIYPGCPLCTYSDGCLSCPWMLFEGCECKEDEYKDNKRSIERLTRWIDKIEKGE
jgi:hypothetical protein